MIGRFTRRVLVLGLGGLALASSASRVAAAEPGPNDYLEFVRARARDSRSHDAPPTTLAEWNARREALRKDLRAAWGGFPESDCPLEPRVLGTIDRGDYRVEKVLFQTRPGVWMTANAYVPRGEGKHPAILQVHGHWRGAKQDPVVQSRCIGAAKLGFFVLVVDAFGAGERGIGEALGEYHGEMTGATLFPIGLPLSGLQAHENQRAVDYLRTRPEVDGDHIGVTGASGGGNQSMYAGANDDRLGAVVPVCSVGTYMSYLGIACCMCEVVPGALRFTEESGILALSAPRGLLVVNATQDGIQFSVGEAQKSIAAARPIFELLGKGDHLRHATFESKHDYNKDMRQTMYGWMRWRLQGQGDGSPIPEPAFETADPESLRCYPGTTRPDDWVTIPRFAAAEARRLLERKSTPSDAASWKTQSEASRRVLAEKILGGIAVKAGRSPLAVSIRDGARTAAFEPEPGIRLTARVEPGASSEASMVVVLDLEGAEAASKSAVAAAARGKGLTVVTLDLRATGNLAWKSDRVGAAPDHNTAEWGLWIGRPLLGQWVVDVRALLDALDLTGSTRPARRWVVGNGPAGVVALAARALDARIDGVAAVGSLASFVTEAPYKGQRLGILAPGILRDLGDIGHLAALAAPGRVVIAGGVSGNGRALPPSELATEYKPARLAYELLGKPGEFRIVDPADAASILEALR